MFSAVLEDIRKIRELVVNALTVFGKSLQYSGKLFKLRQERILLRSPERF